MTTHWLWLSSRTEPFNSSILKTSHCFRMSTFLPSTTCLNNMNDLSAFLSKYELMCRRKDMVMPLSKSGQYRIFKSNRPSTNTSNIVTPTPQPQSVFNLGERTEPLRLTKQRSSMAQRVRSNPSQ